MKASSVRCDFELEGFRSLLPGRQMAIRLAAALFVLTVAYADSCQQVICAEPASITGSSELSEGSHPGSSAIHALLVGVTNYPALSGHRHLNGPANDVDLLTETLTGRFGVPPERVEKLVESAGPSAWPTRSNIEAAFARLAEKVRRGDHVLIFLAGHGSQMPNGDDSDSESDGLDEIFLPRDIGHWDGRSGRVENCISDDEIRQWTNRIRAAGAFVFFIGDFCHSGTSTRNAGPVARALARSRLGIPSDAVTDAKPASASRSEEQDILRDHDILRDGAEAKATKKSVGRQDNLDTGSLDAPTAFEAGGMVALYAAQPHEKAYEDQIPRGGPVHGWLSWALCQVLNETRERLTYRELATRVTWHYQLKRWTRSTPLMIGTGIDQEVLGTVNWSEENPVMLSRRKDPSGSPILEINAGTLRGITVGSILSATPLDSQTEAARSTFFTKVVCVDALKARVVPCDPSGEATDEPARLPARCKLIYSEFGEVGIRVAIERLVGAGEDSSSARSRKDAEVQLKRIVEELSRTSVLPVQFVPDTAEANLVLQLTQAEQVVRLRRPFADAGKTPRYGSSDQSHPRGYHPGQHVPGQPVRSHSRSLGQHQLNGRLDEWLSAKLGQVYRAETLRRTATPPGSRRSRVRLDIDLLIRRKNRKAKQFIRPGHPVVVHDGDEAKLRIRNRGFSPVDLTVLYIAADSTIASIYPDKASDDYNRCRPGETKTIEGLLITDDTCGWEDLIFIGIQGREQPVPRNFGFLASADLEDASRTVRSSGGAVFWNSPFVRFCRASVFRQPGMQRGTRTNQRGDVAIHRLSWNVAR